MPGGHNGAAVSDPQDIKRNEDLAQQCQRRRLRLRVTEGSGCPVGTSPKGIATRRMSTERESRARKFRNDL